MITFSQYIKIQKIQEEFCSEASYASNIGFQEMVKFYQKAKPEEEQEMETILTKNDWSAFKRLIKKVLGIELK